MAKKTTGVWGIDLGQCALKAIRIEKVGDEVVATTFDYIEHPKMLNQPDAEPDQLLREALEKFLSRNSVRGDIVAISVPSQSGLARFVKLPPVEEKKIADIVRFEAKQQIPFSLDEVVWDYQKIGAGTVTDGFAMDTEIGLFAMKRDKVATYLEHFGEVGVDVHIVQMSPLALCNYVSYDVLPPATEDSGEAAGKKECVVVLDIGTDSSNLVVTDGKKIIWQRPIPLGGNHFTRALTKDPFKLTFAKAEHMKRNATKSGAELKQILTALKPVLNDFVGELQRSLGYFTNTHRDAQVSYILGLGNAFRLPGFQRFLSEKLQIDVRKLGKMERLKGDSVIQAPVYTENIMTFGVAYGLALQGIALARLQTNLLPPEIRTERLINAKKPWAVAAAALLFLGVGGLLLGKGKAANEYDPANSAIKAAITKADGLKTDQVAKGKAYKDKLDEFEKAEKELRDFSGFQQGDWLVINKKIAESLPTPVFTFGKDGQIEKFVGIEPLWSPAKTKYIGDDKAFKNAAESHQDYLVAQMEGKPLKDVAHDYRERKLGLKRAANPGKDDKDLLEERDCLEANLMILSIEAVKPRYTKDLGSYYRHAVDLQNRGSKDIQGAVWGGGSATEKAGGWVIAVRGYTSHFDHSNFVIASLGNNLAASFGLPQRFLEAKKKGSATSSASSKGSESTSTAESSSALAGDGDSVIAGRIQHIVLVATTEREKDQIPDLDTVMASLTIESTPQASGAAPPPPGRGGFRGGGGIGGPMAGGGAFGGPGAMRPVVKREKPKAPKGSGGAPPAFMPAPSGLGTNPGADGFTDLSNNSDFRRSSAEGKVKETEFVFLIFWKGPGPEDFGLSIEKSKGSGSQPLGGRQPIGQPPGQQPPPGR
jgi:type IV pilus assembly protein PilM